MVFSNRLPLLLPFDPVVGLEYVRLYCVWEDLPAASDILFLYLIDHDALLLPGGHLAPHDFCYFMLVLGAQLVWEQRSAEGIQVVLRCPLFVLSNLCGDLRPDSPLSGVRELVVVGAELLVGDIIELLRRIESLSERFGKCYLKLLF